METLRNIMHKFLIFLSLYVCVHKYTQWTHIIKYMIMCYIYTHIVYIHVYNLYIHTQNDKHIKYISIYTYIHRVYIYTYAYIIYYTLNIINEILAISLKCSLQIIYIRSFTLCLEKYIHMYRTCMHSVCLMGFMLLGDEKNK